MKNQPTHNQRIKIELPHLVESVSDREITWLGRILLCGFGCGLFTVHTIHLLSDWNAPISKIVVGCVIPMIMVSGIFVGCVWLSYGDLPDVYHFRVAGWTVFAGVCLMGGMALMTWYQTAEGGVIAEPMFMLGNALTGGGLLGFLLGVYDSQQRATRAQVDVARSRAEHRSNQLSVLNRVLRHDIRNHVTVIRGRAEMLVDQSEDAANDVQAIFRRVDKIGDLSEHAREVELLLDPDQSNKRQVDLVPCVRSAIEDISDRHPIGEMHISLPETVPIHAHPLVTSAIKYVLTTAIERSETSTPAVTITTDRIPVGETEYVELQISDTGSRIPDDALTALDRGFETSLDHGSGLELWLVKWVMKASDGELSITTKDSENVVRLRFEPANVQENTPLSSP